MVRVHLGPPLVYTTFNYSEVAQLVEHPAVNRQVAGSSPAFGAIFYYWGITQEAEEAPLLRV